MAPTDPARWIRRTARTAAFGTIAASMLAAYEIQAHIAPPERREALLDDYRRVFLDRVIRLFGVQYTASPEVPARTARARLVVSNHRSAFDIALLLRLFGGRIVSRADLAGWPLIGTIAQRAGTIFVDRSEGLKRAGAARAIRRRLLEGSTVIVFPEGTTYAGDEVRVFHPGVFAALKGLDAEVVPVGMAYEAGTEYREKTFLAHLANAASRARTRAVARIGEPIPAGEASRVLAEHCRSAVQLLVNDARKAFG